MKIVLAAALLLPSASTAFCPPLPSTHTITTALAAKKQSSKYLDGLESFKSNHKGPSPWKSGENGGQIFLNDPRMNSPPKEFVEEEEETSPNRFSQPSDQQGMHLNRDYGSTAPDEFNAPHVTGFQPSYPQNQQHMGGSGSFGGDGQAHMGGSFGGDPHGAPAQSHSHQEDPRAHQQRPGNMPDRYPGSSNFFHRPENGGTPPGEGGFVGFPPPMQHSGQMYDHHHRSLSFEPRGEQTFDHSMSGGMPHRAGMPEPQHMPHMQQPDRAQRSNFFDRPENGGGGTPGDGGFVGFPPPMQHSGHMYDHHAVMEAHNMHPHNMQQQHFDQQQFGGQQGGPDFDPGFGGPEFGGPQPGWPNSGDMNFDGPPGGMNPNNNGMF